MPRNKGAVKTGGRRKGTPNRVTAEQKRIVNELLEDEIIPQIKDSFADLEPKERWDVFIRLLSFVVPKPQNIKFEDVTRTESPVITMVKTLMIQDNATGNIDNH